MAADVLIVGMDLVAGIVRAGSGATYVGNHDASLHMGSPASMALSADAVDGDLRIDAHASGMQCEF